MGVEVEHFNTLLYTFTSIGEDIVWLQFSWPICELSHKMPLLLQVNFPYQAVIKTFIMDSTVDL